jgi:hypothetical protein
MGRVHTSPERERRDTAEGFYGVGFIQALSVSDGIPPRVFMGWVSYKP